MGGGETNCSNASHSISPTWQRVEKRKRSFRRKPSAVDLWAKGRAGAHQGICSSPVPGLIDALHIYLGISKQPFQELGNTQPEEIEFQPLDPFHSASLQLTWTHRKIWKLTSSTLEVCCVSTKPAFSPEESQIQQLQPPTRWFDWAQH